MEFDQSLEEWAKQKPLSILQLDSADRAVLRIADERDAIQKKTFTKWVNKHLSKCGKRVGDLFEDLRDGHNLISLLEVLAAEHLPRERGRMRFHMLQNVQTVLDFLRYRKIKLVNIRAEDIVDANPKLTLGLIWTIILHFQSTETEKISDIVVGMEENVSAKEALLKWAQKSTAKYPGVRVTDFTKSWKDGLAFSALIHRNRPDLVDWRSLARKTPRERLEIAFTIAERECGVVKLLDPEDVDTPEPDEKSVITYISSLYDAFPEPPRLHPLHDTDSQKKWEEYREIGTSLLNWMRQSVGVMQDRHFPPSLIDMRKMATEMNRFRVEEVPSRGQDKMRLGHIFRDVEKHFREGDLDRELHMDNIERHWQILMHAHQEKDQAIHEEIKKLEKLQRLAEKIHREGKQVEIRLDEIEQRIEEEARRIDRLHPLDAKHNCDQLEREMQMTEDTIKSMFSDAQTLRDARFHQASEIQKMVQHLHQRWISIRSLLHNRLLSVLASISFPVEEKSVTRTSKTVMEMRLVETNQHFRVLQEVGDWIRGKHKALVDSDFGSDLPSVHAELEKQQREHRTIEKFQTSVEKCASSKSSFNGEELQLYINYLNTIQKSYSDLLMASRKRTSDLETLMDFVQSATNELMWLSEKEEREITRDWSSKNINLVEVEQYYESLMSELEKREIQFNAVQDRGESLVLQHHPASKCIETYMSAMQSQWAWLLQLTICLETHLKYVATYQQYFSDIRECEQTIARKEEMLNSVFSKSEFSLDEGEILLKEMQDMREDLTKYGDIIQQVSNQSRDIIPLKHRKTNVTRPTIVTAICNYKQNNQQMVINKDERCTLHDNSQRVRWRVTNSSGLEGMVPGVCFLIPPPDKEALDAADRLRKQYDRAVTLWQKKQLKMRQNMIFATIKVVKSWDLTQFLAMGAEQRNAIRKALNEDADKLIQEGDANDPALRRLRREIDEVNRLFDEFEKRALESEKSKAVSKNFAEQVTTLHQELEEMERTLVSRANAPVPKDVDNLERLWHEYRETEITVRTFESRVQTVQRQYTTLPQKTASLQAKVEKVLEKWERVASLSQLYVERLKTVEVVLHSIEETKTYTSQFDMKLASYDTLPADESGLKMVSNDLHNLQNTAHAHQHIVEKMVDETKNVRRVTEKSRPSQKRHPDVDRLEEDVTKVSGRWMSTYSQIEERIKTAEITSQQASKYNSSYTTEMNWLDSVDSQTKSLAVMDGGAKRKINPHMTLYNSVIEEKITIEQVNTMGARLAKEARRYDEMLASYRESLEEDLAPSLNLVKRSKVEKGCSAEEVIYQELDLLNLKYQLAVDTLHQRLQELAIIAQQEDPSFQMPKVPVPSPIQTYRAHAQGKTPLPDFLSPQSQGEDVVDMAIQRSSATLKLTLTPQGKPVKKSIHANGSNGHTNGDLPEESPLADGTSLHFTQIRSAKKVEKVSEGISTDATTIIDPLTGEALTLAQAIGCGLVDLKTGEFIDTRTNERLTLEEASKRGYIDADLLQKLRSPCGLVDPITGEELTFLEAIRKGYYDLAKGVFIHPVTGEPITTEQAIRLGLSTKQKESVMVPLSGEGESSRSLPPFEPLSSQTCDIPVIPVPSQLPLPSSQFPQSVAAPANQDDIEMQEDEKALPKEEPFSQESAELDQLMQAIEEEKEKLDNEMRQLSQEDETLETKTPFLERSLLENIPLEGWTLSELLETPHFSSHTGLFTIPSTDRQVSFEECVHFKIIDASSAEVVGNKGRRYSIPRALEKGILASTGHYNHPQKGLVPLNEAVKMGLVILKDKEIKSIQAKEDTPEAALLLDAVLSGEIDPALITLVDPKTGHQFTMQEAIQVEQGKDSGSKRNANSGEKIKEALKLGALAIVGAPVLGVKSVIDKIKAKKEETCQKEEVKTEPKSMPMKSLTEAESHDEGTTPEHGDKIKINPDLQTIPAKAPAQNLQPQSPVVVPEDGSDFGYHHRNDKEDDLAAVLESDSVKSKSVSGEKLKSTTTPESQPKEDKHETSPEENKSLNKVLQPEDKIPESPKSLEAGKEMEVRILSEEVIPFETVTTTTTTTTTSTVILTKISRKKVPITSTFVTDSGILSRETVSILTDENNFVDPAGHKISLKEAIGLGKVDGNSGAILDPVSADLLTINEALIRNLLVEGTGENSVKDLSINVPVGRSVTVPELRSQGLYDPSEGKIIHPETGKGLTLSQAIVSDVLYSQSPVVDPKSGRKMSITEALKGKVISEKGEIADMTLADAVEKGAFADIRHPMEGTIPKVALSLDTAKKLGLFDSGKGVMRNPSTGEVLSLEDAVTQGKVMTADFESLSNSMKKSEGEASPGTSKLEVKLRKSPEKEKKVTFVDVPEEQGPEEKKPKLEEGNDVTLLDPEIIVIDPSSGKSVALKNVPEAKRDLSSLLVKDPSSGKSISVKDALKIGLLAPLAAVSALLPQRQIEVTTKGKKNVEEAKVPELKAVEAEEEDDLSSYQKPYSLQVALAKGLYSPDTGLLLLADKTDKETTTLSLDAAISSGLISGSVPSVKDPRTGEVVSLEAAIKTGLIDTKTGHFLDPVSSSEMTFDQAQEAGLLLSPKKKKKVPLSDLLYSEDGYIPEMNTVLIPGPEGNRIIPLKEAFTNNELDTSSLLVKIDEKTLIPFKDAIEKNLVNLEEGKVGGVSFKDALDAGSLIEARTPLSLSEVVMKGLFKEDEKEKGPFTDPQTGKGLTLKDSLLKGVIDSGSVHVQDTRSGFAKKMPLLTGIEEGFVSEIDGSVKDFSQESQGPVPLSIAMEKGLIIDSRKPLSLQRGLKSGIYSEETGRITDPITGKKIILNEAMRRLVVDPNLPLLFDEEEGKVLSLVESCRKGRVNRHEGTLSNEAGGLLTLSDALKDGVILDIEKPFSLYQALKLGLYSATDGKFVHPRTGKRLTLSEAVKEDMISPEESVIRSGEKILKLEQGVKGKIVDAEKGLMKNVEGGGLLPLDEARKEGLILTPERPLSLIKAVAEEHLYSPEKGRIADPLLGQWLTLKEAIVDKGLIEEKTAAVKNLRTQAIKGLLPAIEDGEIIDDRGLVIDGRNGKPTPFHRAIEQGILIPVEKPVSFAEALKEELLDLKRGAFFDPRTGITSPLHLAVNNELIDSSSCVVRHPEIGNYVNIREAVKMGLIDLKRRGLISPRTGKLGPLCLLFEGGSLIYLRESLSFDQALNKGLLSLKKGTFSDEEGPITLKEAVDIGAIDGRTAVIKDTLRKKLVTLPLAFSSSLIDPDSGRVLDTGKNRSESLEEAIKEGTLLSPRKALSLLEALEYGVYDQDSGKFRNPFGGSDSDTSDSDNEKRNDILTLSESLSLAQNLIDPVTTMVKDPVSGRVLSLQEAMDEGILDGEEGLFLHTGQGTRHNLLEAWKRGWLLPAEARLATEAQYKQCDATISNLSGWLDDVERRLASQETLRETVEEIRKQTMTVKQIRDDIEDHSQTVSTCLDQVRHLVATGGEVLSSEEISTLEKNGRVLKQRYDCVSNYSESLYRQLTTANDELKKYKQEVTTFKTWMEKSVRVLEEKERNVSNLSSSGRDNTKEFVSDVIAHQGDLRFIAMSGQKFIEESREYLGTLNEFRTNLPQRLPYLEARESTIKHEVQEITRVYQDLLSRANRLFDKLAQLGNKQKDFQDALNKAMAWLKEVTPRVQKVLSEPVAGEPRLVEDQLNRAKALQNEILSSGRLIEAVRQASNALLTSMDELSPAERDAVEKTTKELENKYKDLLDAVGEKIKDLDSALVQSQGLQDAVDGVSNWLNQAEFQMKNIDKPASLIRERLDEQIREVKMLQADIDSHRPSIESMARSADDLLRSRTATVSKKVEGKLKDVLSRYEKLVEKLVQRSVTLNEVSTHLDSFSLSANYLEQWFSEMYETLETRLTGDDAAARLEEMVRKRELKKSDFDDTISSGKSLVGKKGVTDTQPVKDKIKALENQWKDFGISLDEKSKLGRTRTEALNAYEKMRDQVHKWLSSTESRFSSLSPVAVDSEILKSQENELKPLIKEHRDYASTIDKVNELGNAYDALTRGGVSPTRRGAASPVKRPSFRSTDGRSPSPSKTTFERSPMSPSGSSGFGSRRTSQEGFLNIEDASPVQQQLNEINQRYSLLGAKLSDRQNEIDATRDEIKKIADNLKALAQFLDKTERAFPKESIPQSKEEAERMLKTIKMILEDMYDKQGMLDSTRTLITDLVRRKPNAGGVDNLQETYEGVLQRWKDLQDRCKSRVGFLESVKEFLDSHDNLNSWLTSKDKMLAVLGPIASDPRMVQSQMQQVQVMRDEFRAQKPILDSFNNSGDSILAKNGDGPDAKKIEDKLANINQRWNELLHKLDDREGNLDAASNASQDFFNNLNKLQDNLHKISDDLDDLIADKGDPEEMLRKLSAIEKNLNAQRPVLADVEATGAELCDILQDPAAKSDIKQKLAQVGRLFNQCQKKLDNCKAELENSRKDGVEFNEACEAAQDWLADMLKYLSDKLLVSADRDILRGQFAEFEPIYKEIMSKEHEIVMTLNKGKEVMTKARKQEQKIIQQNIEKVQKGWDKLKKEAVDRHTRLQTCTEHCKKYDRARETFITWLTSAEDKFESFQLTSYKKQDIDKLLKEVNMFKNELWRHAGEYDSTRGLGETFISACDKDKDGVKGELQDMKERWDALNNAILGKVQELEDAAAKLAEFNDSCRDLKNALGRCEDKLSSHDALGDAAKDPKLLQRIKAIQDEVRKLDKPLDHVQKQGEDLSGDANRNHCDDAHIRDAVNDLLDRFENLNSKLGDRFQNLESAQKAMEDFMHKMKTIGTEIGNLESEINGMKPVGRDIPTVKGQIREMEQFNEKVRDKKDDLSHATSALDELVRQGVAADPKGMKEQIDSFKKQVGRIEERAKQRDQELEKALQRLESFYELYNTTNGDIDDLIQQEKSFSKSVGGDVESIRAQQKEFKAFRSKYFEAVGKKVDECNKSGQGLIQSAANGVNTTGLEKDLEKLNDKWNALKERINEQERKLDVALLQSGKFREALDGLDKWLSEMEDLVANQKPPSADYKVVKAQLQEQGFLNKMLLDRQPSVTSLFQMGKEIAASAEPAERAQIEDQMNNMKDRYGSLCDGAKERQGLLEDAMKVAKAFQDVLGPLTDWLEKQTQKLKDMSMIPTDEDKIARRMKEHDSFHDGLLKKQPAFAELADIAQTLMNLVGDEDATGVADKLQEVTDRYGRLIEESERLGNLLRQAKAGLRNLVLSYEELVAWMDSVEKRLNKFRVVSVHREKLLDQMDQLTVITEEIKGHEGQVDATLEAGLDLMRNISSEEAIQLKDKLDSLQRRFHDITTKAGDLLKNAQEALPLVTQFHECHTNICEWMEGAEDFLKSLDNSNLTAQEKIIVRLESEIVEMRKVLDVINLVGPQLCQLSPGEGASTIEGLVTRDNRRFDAICEQVQRRAERIKIAQARSREVLSDIDDLLDWFREIECQLRDAEKPSCEPDIVRVQLQEHRTLNDEINSQKSRVREILATAKKVLREATQGEDTATLREKAEDLKETMENVSKMSSDRLNALEQALPLAEHFFDTHFDLNQWMDAMEDEMAVLDTPAIRPDQIAKLQERTQAFLQSLNEHKPLVDKLNKTGGALVKICNDEDSGKVQEIMDADNERYNTLRVSLRDKQQALEKALQETSQFKDKLDGMLNALENTADQCKNAEPISAHPKKIKEQIADNEAIIDDVKKREDAFHSVKKQAADLIEKAPNKNDPAVRDIKQKLDRLNSLWDQIQKLTSQRGKNLDEALALAEKFWEQLQAILDRLDALSETLKNQEPPAVEPKAIQQQQEVLKEIKKDIEKAKPEVSTCRQSGQNLLKIVGEQDKPEIKKNIEELDSAWDNITALFAKREENLIDAMEKAMEFHETLQDLLRFLDKAEARLASFEVIGLDIEAVKKQIKELKEFKAEVDPMMVKVEALNRQAQELTERTSPDQAAKIKAPLTQVNRRWDDLLKGIVERQRELENALLRLGQFQHALSELMAWIDKTNKGLDALKPVFGDPQIIEVELAKLKVMVNDIQNHQNSVDTLNDAGRQIIESERGSDNASKIQGKLNDLNVKWEDLQKKALDRQKELEDALREAQAFNAEIQDLLFWLNDVDGALQTSKPTGGLPETAQEQLNRFMEIYTELETNRPKVEAVLQQGQEYLKKSTEGSATNLAHNLRTLRQRWESVMSRANDKKIKLEIALKEAMEFHKSVQDFIDWLTEAERYLTCLEPVSRVLDKVVEQVESHKEFQKEISAHREVMLNLEKKGNHLKYFSQKQDVILIKNLLISVQHRWDRVVSKSTERTRALDLGLKEAKEFNDSWSSLMKWLDEAEKSLDEIVATAGQNPQKIKQMLTKHKEFQRLLATKQPSYDSTMKTGKILKDKAPKADEPVLRQMLTDLKNKWNSVCNKSVDKQRNLEEALLRSGQFKDALQELLDWLKEMDRLIVDDGPVHGDLDTVQALIEQHKKLEQELNNRKTQMNEIIRTAEEMMETAQGEEKAKLQSQIKEVQTSFEKVKKKCETRSRRLEEALKDAEKLHTAVHMLLEWLSDAEMKLRFAGQLPEDEETTKRLLEEQEAFMKELKIKEKEKDETLELAKAILAKAHPDAVPVIKHWISIIQTRWEEISSWAVQRQQKLQAHLNALRDAEQMLEELMKWLQKCEDTLTQLEAESLPDDLNEIMVLIKEHKEFMEGMAARQSEIDAVCKPKLVTRPPGAKGKPTPRLKSATPGDSREGSPEMDFAHRRLSAKVGSREGTPMSRLDSPGGEDLFPHIGPRFDRRGSKAVEPQIKNPRVKALWDKWKHVWMMAWERQRRLQDKLKYLEELEKVKNFSWEDWRKRFLKFMNHKKSRVIDLFRKIDKNNDNLIPREEFIDAIMKTKFPTSRLEMNAVADMFDHGDHLIDYLEFIAALRADWEDRKPQSEGDLIEDEIQKLVQKCTCRQKFRVFQVGEGKYRFGESQKLRLVRILRSTVMVRVGGGWVALDEFLVKNDPCRAKGRTNIELREQFILADGVSQTMTAFRSKPSAGSTVSSGNRSAQSLPAQGPITKVRERSIKSVPMGRARSTDRTTPDSTFSEDGFSLSKTPRRTSAGPGRGSQPGSRSGSKPPSRSGSQQSLDSTDDHGTRIPVRRAVSLKRGTSGSFSGGRGGGPSATSTPSRPGFNLNGSRGPTQERAHSFTKASTVTPIKRTGSSSSISSLTNSTGRPSRIPMYVGGETGSVDNLDRSRTPSNSNIPVAVAQQSRTRASLVPSPGSGLASAVAAARGTSEARSTQSKTSFEEE